MPFHSSCVGRSTCQKCVGALPHISIQIEATFRAERRPCHWCTFVRKLFQVQQMRQACSSLPRQRYREHNLLWLPGLQQYYPTPCRYQGSHHHDRLLQNHMQRCHKVFDWSKGEFPESLSGGMNKQGWTFLQHNIKTLEDNNVAFKF